MKKKKVAVIGAMYSLNLGDAVICDIVSKICELKEYDVVTLSITGSSDFPSITKKQPTKKGKQIVLKNSGCYKVLMMRHHYQNLIKKLEALDNDVSVILFAGGQMFMEYFTLPIYIIVQWAKKKNIPVIFNCCGIGVFEHTLVRKKLIEALNAPNVVSITVRDGLSEIKKICKNHEIRKINDAALECSYFYPKKINPHKIVGIGLIDMHNFREEYSITKQEYFNAIKRIVNMIINVGFDYEFFTNGEVDDYDLTKEFCLKLGIVDKIVPRPKSGMELIDTITSYSYLVSSRLHSHIIATSYGIPTVALAWDNKVLEFMKTIGREQYVIKIKEDRDSDRIEKILDTFLLDENCIYPSQLISSSENITQLFEAL